MENTNLDNKVKGYQCYKHQRCIEAGPVNCIRGFKKPKIFNEKWKDPKIHYWKHVRSSKRPDGQIVIVERCKKKWCDQWRWVGFEWKEVKGVLTMVPSVQYVTVPNPKDT